MKDLLSGGGGPQRDKQAAPTLKDKNGGLKPSSSGVSNRKDRPPIQRSRPSTGATVERARDRPKFTPTATKGKFSGGRRSDTQRHAAAPRTNDSHANARRLLLQAKRTKTNSSKKIFHVNKSRQPVSTQQHRSREPQKYRQKQPKPRDRR
uniref:Uncharacterized protein n=2 Tax=Plectus sambesii TaxID=2011161 RepID=A0A914XF73_9BILA